MAALPEIPMPTEKVETPGGPVLVRGLSAVEAEKVRKIFAAGDMVTFQITVVSFATDTPKPDAKRWVESVPAGIVNDIVAVCNRLSGLEEEAAKSGEGGTPEG